MMGIFIPTTMAVSSLTALTLLPALTVRLRPKFLFGEGRSAGSQCVIGTPLVSCNSQNDSTIRKRGQIYFRVNTVRRSTRKLPKIDLSPFPTTTDLAVTGH
jgi:hypothetical protein